MLRKKSLKTVIAFHTTADAMAMEALCKAGSHPGRLIPVPRSISAGCGLAWCADLADAEILKKVMSDGGIEPEGIHECMI